MYDVNSPVFVVGVPRSGTTVFSVKLAEATGIAMAPETHFLPEVYARLKELDLSNDGALDKALTKFQSGRWFDDLGLELEQIKTAFRSHKQRDWAGLFSVILQLHARSNGAERWGEKTPGHYLYVDQLLRWYADCRIVFVMRDPRAVVASSMRAPFSPSYAWFVARRWNQVWDIYQSFADDPRVLMVQYEDFVADSESVLARVKQWLGIDEKVAPPSQSVVSGTTVQRGWRVQHLQTAVEAVNAGSLERWRKQLSPYEIWVTERYSGAGSSDCGYDFASTKAGDWWHRLNHIHRFPRQRLELAVEAAARVVDGGGKPNLKQQTLLMVGAAMDMLNLLIARQKKQPRKVDGKQAVIQLGSKHCSQSSFLPLSDEGETLGLFVTALCDLGYRISLVAKDREQFFVAKKLVKAYGLSECVVARHSPSKDPEQDDRVELYWPGRKLPTYSTDNLCISPANAKRVAKQIDAFPVSDSCDQHLISDRNST